MFKIRYCSNPDYDDGFRFTDLVEIWRIIFSLTEECDVERVQET